VLLARSSGGPWLTIIGPVDVVHEVWLTTALRIGSRCAGGFWMMEEWESEWRGDVGGRREGGWMDG
jgi:hypothetical protein